MQLGDIVSQYIWYAEHVRHRAASTLKQRKLYLGEFVTHCNSRGLHDFCEITNMDIDIYHAEYSKKVTRSGTIVAPSTVNNGSIASIRAFFHWARNVKQIDTKVVPSEIVDIKVPDKHPDIITFSDVQKVVNSNCDYQDRLIIATIFECGLRIQELCSMQISDLRGRKLDVIGKGDKHRITFMSHDLSGVIQEYWRSQGWHIGAAFRPLLHSRGNLGYQNDDTVRQRIQRCFARVLDKKVNPHWLRHAFALNLLENECGLRTIQKLLGHSKIETTMRYLGVTDKYLEREYDANFGGSVIKVLT